MDRKVMLYSHQKDALERLGNGKILVGGVGSGKSITSIAYYWTKICGGKIGEYGSITSGGDGSLRVPLYIITTARKRDTKDWEEELERFGISSDYGWPVVVDSWNNIKKYCNVSDAFFIFDEQRVCGYGAWSKHFLEITKKNRWILLSATPGDVWMDYIPVFIANGFYPNKTQFCMNHVVFKFGVKYPIVDHYVNTGILEKYRKMILVPMDFKREAIRHVIDVAVQYDDKFYKVVSRDRWNIYSDEPIKNASELCYTLRKIVNSDPSRMAKVCSIIEKQKDHRVIIFYNYEYERSILLGLGELVSITVYQWNGKIHETLPKTGEWIYLVQYTAGCEGWNCTETDTIIFYSLNYSYKVMEQAFGRIDRLNTPYSDLYYYLLKSKSGIDGAISRAIKTKKNFNEKAFYDLK